MTQKLFTSDPIEVSTSGRTTDVTIQGTNSNYCRIVTMDFNIDWMDFKMYFDIQEAKRVHKALGKAIEAASSPNE